MTAGCIQLASRTGARGVGQTSPGAALARVWLQRHGGICTRSGNGLQNYGLMQSRVHRVNISGSFPTFLTIKHLSAFLSPVYRIIAVLKFCALHLLLLHFQLPVAPVSAPKLQNPRIRARSTIHPQQLPFTTRAPLLSTLQQLPAP